MKALSVTSPGKFEIIELSDIKIGDYECLVRNRSCGFCNCTDMEMINNEFVDISFTYPMLLGHEGAGEVVEAGKKVKNYKIGDRITFPDIKVNEPGYTLSAGHYMEYGYLKDLQAMRDDGIDIASYQTGAAWLQRKFPSTISFEDAGVIIPIRENYSGVRNMQIGKGSKVLVYGDGPNGLGLALFSKYFGADWVGVAGHHDKRLKHIKDSVGVDAVINTNNQSVDDVIKGITLDTVIVAVSSMQLVIESSHKVRQGGRVVLYSAVHNDERRYLDPFKFNNNVLFQKHYFPSGDFDANDEVIALIENGTVDPKIFYSHTVPLDDFKKAVEMNASREAFKVVVTM